MAQTQAHAHAHTDVEDTNVGPSAADVAAWCEAAKARKYCVHENIPYSYGSEMVFPLPAPVGFAALNASVRPLVFQSVAQFVTNRIGQIQDGNVAEKIAACLATGAGMPSAHDNNAFDSAYYDHIAALIENKLGAYNVDANGNELKGDALKAAKAKRDAQIIANASHAATRAKHYDNAVKMAVERGRNKPSSGKAKRTAKSADPSVLMDL